jgi:hypothetical protein
MEFISSKENTVLLSGLLVTLLLAGLAVAQNSDTATVDVSISASMILDVNPNETSWSSLSIGGTSSYATFYIENIGSQDISNVEANVTGNDTRPYGASTAGAFDAGNFLMLNSSGAPVTAGEMFYIYKREFNETQPTFVTPPTDWLGSGNDEDVSTFVKFKSAIYGSTDGQEYYMFANRSGANDDCTTGVLYIGNVNHTKEWTGSIDFTNAAHYFTETATDGGDGYGYINLTEAGHDLDYYCVRVSANCQTVDFFHWDVDTDSGANCNADEYVYTGTLAPGSNFEVYLQARIPFGVASGSAETAILSFVAS